METGTSPSGAFSPVLSLAIIAAVVAAAYSPALEKSFVDDDWEWLFILSNRDPAEGLVTDVTAMVRPVRDLWWLTEYRMFGFRAWAYQLANMVHHTLNAFLLFLFCRRLGVKPLAATLAVSYFSCAFVHRGAVLLIAAVADHWMFTFFLLALVCGHQALHSRAWAWRILTASFVLLALLSKELAAPVLPALFAMSVICAPPAESWRRSIRRGAVVFLPAVIIGAPVLVFLALRLSRNTYLTDGVRPGWRMVPDVFKVVTSSVLPTAHSINLPSGIPDSASFAAEAFSLVLYVAVSLTLILALFKWGRSARMGIAILVMTVLPILINDRVMATWLYLPAAGACLVIGEGLERVLRLRFSRPYLTWTALVGFVLFVALNMALMRHKANSEVQRALFIENLVFQVRQYMPLPPSDGRIYLNILDRPVIYGWPGALKLSYERPDLEIVHASAAPRPEPSGSTLWYFEVNGMEVRGESIKPNSAAGGESGTNHRVSP